MYVWHCELVANRKVTSDRGRVATYKANEFSNQNVKGESYLLVAPDITNKVKFKDIFMGTFFKRVRHTDTVDQLDLARATRMTTCWFLRGKES